MVNVFSFCLYGPENPIYYQGMLENIYLAGMYFPDWKVYTYVGSDVPEEFIQRMAACSNVVIRRTEKLGAQNMIERFYAIDEPDVEIMMVRDADSRIHWRDRWCIREFVKSTFVAHTIRDNGQHTAKMMGGLWGLRKSAGLSMRQEYASYQEDTSRGWRHAHDQNFLGDVIYSKVLDRMLIHYSNGRRSPNEHAIEIPFEWSNDCFCGRIERTFVNKQPPSRSIKPFRLQGPLPNLTTLYR
jgi:hypothetical protein